MAESHTVCWEGRNPGPGGPPRVVTSLQGGREATGVSGFPQAGAGSPSVSIYQMALAQAPALRLDGWAVLAPPNFCQSASRAQVASRPLAVSGGRGQREELEAGS